MWDIAEGVREVVGAVESKLVRCMVSLSRIPSIEARVWPERFRTHDAGNVEGDEFKGYYLIGVSAREVGESDEKKVMSGKVLSAVREFEGVLRETREVREGNVWVSVDVVSRKKLLGMGFVVDEREWGIATRLSVSYT